MNVDGSQLPVNDCECWMVFQLMANNKHLLVAVCCVIKFHSRSIGHGSCTVQSLRKKSLLGHCPPIRRWAAAAKSSTGPAPDIRIEVVKANLDRNDLAGEF